jgi:hypothetical protein
MKTAVIMLPQGAAPGKIEVVAGAKNRLPGAYKLKVAPLPTPVGGDWSARRPPRTDATWSGGAYPGKLYEFRSVQHLREPKSFCSISFLFSTRGRAEDAITTGKSPCASNL